VSVLKLEFRDKLPCGGLLANWMLC